ncbi:MAG TPA: site-specific integrase, partial [Kiloniellaceae bacterium]|nr:site-specific integrase [Kiloniellaceae bacterium]
MSLYDERLEPFLEMLLVERGVSANTLEAYRRDLDAFQAYLRKTGRTMREADSDGIRGFLAMLTASGMAPRTQARRLSALRQYYRYLLAEGLRDDDPSAAVDSPRLGRTLPKVLDEAEVDKLLAAARRQDGPEGLRLIAILELLYATGLRISELVSLPMAAAFRDPRFL